jgi:hypothetical protein
LLIGYARTSTSNQKYSLEDQIEKLTSKGCEKIFSEEISSVSSNRPEFEKSLNPNTPPLMDGEVRLFKRNHSSIWQVVFMMDGRQVRVSTKKRILKDAKEAAREIYLDYRVRQKNGLPVISKRFASVAALCRATIAEQLENGVGKKSFCDYIILIDKYLVPFFGDVFVTSIDYEMLQGLCQNKVSLSGQC